MNSSLEEIDYEVPTKQTEEDLLPTLSRGPSHPRTSRFATKDQVKKHRGMGASLHNISRSIRRSLTKNGSWHSQVPSKEGFTPLTAVHMRMDYQNDNVLTISKDGDYSTASPHPLNKFLQLQRDRPSEVLAWMFFSLFAFSAYLGLFTG
jgi:hypothetical protein